jgi:serine/threonine protein phosphatase PrpC
VVTTTHGIAHALEHSTDPSGCTFIGLIIDENRNKFKILNIGDSRAIYKTGNGKIYETKDHKPYHGQLAVENVSGTLRIGGTLAVGRTIGDNTKDCFGYVSHKATMYQGTIVPGHTKFILASDGIYDIADITSSDFYTHIMNLETAKDVFEFTKKRFKEHICKYTKKCTHDVVLDDNTTVIVVTI